MRPRLLNLAIGSLVCCGIWTAIALLSQSFVLASSSVEAVRHQGGGSPGADTGIVVDPDCEGHHSCGKPCEECHWDSRGGVVQAAELAASGDKESVSAVQDWLARRQAVTWLYGPLQYLPTAPGQPWIVAGRAVTVTHTPGASATLRVGMFVEVRGIRQPDGGIVAMRLNLCDAQTPVCYRPMPASIGAADQAVTAPPVTPEEIGKLVFLKIGCQACHAIDGVAQGTVAPPLSSIYAVAAGRIQQPDYRASQGAADSPEAYILESIVTPRAYVVPQCPAGPCDPSPKPQNYRDVMKPDELAALVAYLASLGRTR